MLNINKYIAVVAFIVSCFFLHALFLPNFFQSYCDDPDLVLELKNLIVLFADTLQVEIYAFQKDYNAKTMRGCMFFLTVVLVSRVMVFQ